MRRVLVLNTGSSSLKWVALDAETEAVLEQGVADLHADQFERAIEATLRTIAPVAAVGHRVVHGGSKYVEAVLVDERVRASIEELTPLAPLHNPSALLGIDAAQRIFPSVPQIAAFDTAFHATLPRVASTYALPMQWAERWALRRYGFHGLSVRYALRRVTELMGEQPARLVVCHLGAGCSVTAVADGKSIDTSMGFTPLEGLMMARRSGSIDPGLLVYLLRTSGLSLDELDHGLNEASGLLGVSGISADVRDVLEAADQGNERAALAAAMFVDRAVGAVGGMLGHLRGLDALVFTGGIGEHNAIVRAGIADAFGFAGVRLDGARNAQASGDAELTGAGAAVRSFAIATREDLTILADVKHVLAHA